MTANYGNNVPALFGAERPDTAQWEHKRRPELLELFKDQMFGRNPVARPEHMWFEVRDAGSPAMDGAALRKLVDVCYRGPGGEGRIGVVAFLPQKPAPAPAFLFICNRDPAEHLDASRTLKSPFWPAEALVARGYAAVAFFNGDAVPDAHDGFASGAHKIFQPDPSKRGPDAWGTIAAWAWGAGRVMDWLETEPMVDPARVAVIGHSRGGKTALWCGATDTRFALAISNGSGCAGAKLNRMDLPQSESIARINTGFPHWFCENFKQYNDREDALPFDQHMLVALMAPRLAYVASATEDSWAGPPGEFASCVLASPAWELYGRKGLAGETFPAPETPLHGGSLGYHLSTGRHSLTPEDWNYYMDFTDRHWGVPG